MGNDPVLVTGAEGMLGSYFDFGLTLTKSALDVSDPIAVREMFIKHKPNTVVHLAALTDLSVCEQKPNDAYRINTLGTLNVATAAQSIGATMVFLSTSGVFDGKQSTPYVETDTPNPINVYGRSKYLAEEIVKSLLKEFLIIRTSWLFGGGREKDTKFVGKILKQCRQAEIVAVTDRVGSPTYAKDLARATQHLIAEGKRGTIHIGGGSATRYDVANEILKSCQSSALLRPVESAIFEKNAGYVSGKNESIPLSPYVRPWQEALQDYIRTEWGTKDSI